MAAPLSLIRCRPTLGKRFLSAPVASSTALSIAADGTMVVRTDTYGAYIWNGTRVAAARDGNKHAGRLRGECAALQPGRL